MPSPQRSPSVFARIGLAFRILGNSTLAARLAGLPAEAVPPAEEPAEKVHAAALALLGLLQREGRLVDFLQEDVSRFSDAEIGGAARVVHAGCHKVLREYLDIEPALPQAEGTGVTVPQGFDAARIRLTGNVAGQPPYHGTVKHHGWAAKSVRFPAISRAVDPRILAPAEVEL